MTTDKINQVVDDSMTSPFCLVGSIVFIRQAYEYVVVDVDVREETSIANDRIYIYMYGKRFSCVAVFGILVPQASIPIIIIMMISTVLLSRPSFQRTPFSDREIEILCLLSVREAVSSPRFSIARPPISWAFTIP